MLNEVPFTDSN